MRCTDAERRLLTSTLLPNGSPLSCGALKNDSFLNLRAPPASSACVRRTLIHTRPVGLSEPRARQTRGVDDPRTVLRQFGSSQIRSPSRACTGGSRRADSSGVYACDEA